MYIYKMYVITHFTFQAPVKPVRSCVSTDKLSVRMFKNFLIKILILFGAVMHKLSNIKNVLMFFWASYLQNMQVVFGACYQLDVWLQVWGFVFSAS